MKFDVLDRFSGEVKFTAEIDCDENALPSLKLGLAVKWAIKEKANLSSADLSCAKNSEMAVAMTRILPEGTLIGWKKCMDDIIVKVRIPEEAKRSHAFGRKCRAEYVDVIEVIGAEKAISLDDGKTEYVTGQRVTPNSFDEDWTEECSSGIHFFITRLEAESYSWPLTPLTPLTLFSRTNGDGQ